MTDVNQAIDLLLVDDEVDFRQAASRSLERQGFAVRLAESGEQALELLAEKLPAVVILDLRMPGMDGIATLGILRERHPNLPVIILTGHGRYADALAGIQMKIVDFVQKPVDMKDLGDRIRALLVWGAAPSLREKTITELMTPPDRFQRIQADQPVRDLVLLLFDSISSEDLDDPIGHPRRAALVFDRQDRFQGIVRIADLVRQIVPDALRNSPYSSYYTGMFLAQVKTIGSRPTADFVIQRASISPDSPLMEAIHVLQTARRHDLPVISAGKLVGVLRGQEVFQEIARAMLIGGIAQSEA